MKSLLPLLSFLLLIAPAAAAAPAPLVVLNKGIGGNNSLQGRQRFDRDVLPFHPQHLVIYFGINDAVNPGKLLPPETYRDNLQWMIDQARAARIGHIVLITPHPIIESLVRRRHPEGYPYKESLNDHILKYDAIVRELARTNQTDLADLRALVNRHGDSKATKESMIRNLLNVQIADGVHFTTDGYRLMAELVAESFKGKIQPGQTVVCFGDSLTYGTVPLAGTPFGQTYPAVLNDRLNTMVGADPHARAFPRPHAELEKGQLLLNAGFEDTADGLTPYQWQLRYAKGRYEGTLRWQSQGSAQGKHHAQVVATDPGLVAYLLSPRIQLPAQAPLKITFKARGSGEVRLQLNQYGGRGGRSPVAPPESSRPAETWRTVLPQWQTFTLTCTPPAEATHLTLAFLVRGRVDLDDITLAPPGP